MGQVILLLVIALIVFSAAKYLKTEQIRQPTYLPNYSTILSLPAIDDNGKGVSVRLTVETKDGEDRILTNIDKLLFWVDTQESIQTAKSVAKNLTGISTSAIDIIYTLEGNNATLVGGPSAGAALTVATVSALEQKPLNMSVAITGTIEGNGTIGKVGGIEQKAMAAKEAGAKLLLIPENTTEKTKLKPVETCEKDGLSVYCEVVYKEMEFDLSKEIGIEIKEIKDIEEALRYFNL